jgi:hypothetical protein
MTKRENVYAFAKRAFLNPASTLLTSYIQAHVQTGHDGPDKFGDNIVIIADCKNVIKIEFFLGNKRARRISLAKINLLITILVKFRNALKKEIALIEKGNTRRPAKKSKTQISS